MARDVGNRQRIWSILTSHLDAPVVFNHVVDGMSTPKQVSIRTMHQALFANIDEDDGMSQTIATLQGLRGMEIDENEKSRSYDKS